MKWVIASDLHGSAEHCEKLMEACERERAEKLILLGDLLYRGSGREEAEEARRAADLLNGMKDRILCVRGNCDSEWDQERLDFPILAEYELLSVGETLIFATHGHRYHSGRLPPIDGVDILLHGHTHVPVCTAYPDHLYLNPGSVSRPRGGSRRSYMTFDGERFCWKTLAGETYHTFDRKRTGD